MAASYYHCFGRGLSDGCAAAVHGIADKVWYALYWKEISNVPNVGQSPSDFRSFDDVLAHAAGADTSVFRFALESTGTLRDLGDVSAAERWGVSDMYDKVNHKVDVFDWLPGMKLGQLLLPCATAEVSSNPERHDSSLLSIRPCLR